MGCWHAAGTLDALHLRWMADQARAMIRELYCSEEGGHGCKCSARVRAQACGCKAELSAEEVEEGEVDQLVKRLVTHVHEVRAPH